MNNKLNFKINIKCQLVKRNKFVHQCLNYRSGYLAGTDNVNVGLILPVMGVPLVGCHELVSTSSHA